MKLVRRVHLYLGLFLTPWVFLYGVSALLFNHPTWLSREYRTRVGGADLAGSAFASIPSARDLAAQAIRQLQEDEEQLWMLETPTTSPAGGQRRYALLDQPAPRFDDDLLVRVTGERQIHLVRLSMTSGQGRIQSLDVDHRSPPPAPPPVAPFSRAEGFVIEEGLLDRLVEAVQPLLARKGFEGGRATVQTVPHLRFAVAVDGEPWLATYDPRTGELEGVPLARAGQAMTGREFLTDLHLAHGYAAGWTDIRTIWAVLVDAMGLVMIVWGITGLLMWWQIKVVRWTGGALLVLSAIMAVFIALGMHAQLSA